MVSCAGSVYSTPFKPAIASVIVDSVCNQTRDESLDGIVTYHPTSTGPAIGGVPVGFCNQKAPPRNDTDIMLSFKSFCATQKAVVVTNLFWNADHAMCYLVKRYASESAEVAARAAAIAFLMGSLQTFGPGAGAALNGKTWFTVLGNEDSCGSFVDLFRAPDVKSKYYDAANLSSARGACPRPLSAAGQLGYFG